MAKKGLKTVTSGMKTLSVPKRGSKSTNVTLNQMVDWSTGAAPPRFANQRHAMLYGFSLAGIDGYTREQAAKAANINLRSCFWKRAGELIDFSYLEKVMVGGEQLTRKSDLDGDQGVWRITKEGRKQLEMWGWR
jgi:hypothetical protein